MLDPIWYRIPDYTGYEINVETMQIRSFKNHKADPYHIMTPNKTGAATLYKDDGNRVTRKPSYFYDITFNGDKPPTPAPTYGIQLGSRRKLSKSQSQPIQMNFTKFITK